MLNQDSGRVLSKMSKTTAASVNQTIKPGSQSMVNKNFKKSFAASSKISIGKRTAGSAVGRLTKPNSIANKSQQFKTAGDILNYPYSFDQDTRDEETIALDNKLAK